MLLNQYFLKWKKSYICLILVGYIWDECLIQQDTLVLFFGVFIVIVLTHLNTIKRIIICIIKTYNLRHFIKFPRHTLNEFELYWSGLPIIIRIIRITLSFLKRRILTLSVGKQINVWWIDSVWYIYINFNIQGHYYDLLKMNIIFIILFQMRFL